MAAFALWNGNLLGIPDTDLYSYLNYAVFLELHGAAVIVMLLSIFIPF